MNAPPINDPEAKLTRIIKIRFRKASFRLIKSKPVKAIRLTKATDARITSNLDIFSTSRKNVLFTMLNVDFSKQEEVYLRFDHGYGLGQFF
jgi:hypothetical protein